jgi:hypothetical protein
MTQLKTLQIALCGALAGAAIGTLALHVHPGRNDVSLVWVWIAMAATCATLGAAATGALSGTWNFFARRPAG